jgi:hypothetical protein
MTGFAKISKNLGVDFLEVKETAKEARIETRELAESKLDELEEALKGLGEAGSDNLDPLADKARKASERLAALNRSFELQHLERTDKPMATYLRRLDEIAIAEKGIDGKPGLDPFLAFQARVDALKDFSAAKAEIEAEDAERDQEARDKKLEEEQKVLDKIAEIRAASAEAALEAERKSAEASAAMQEEFFSGTQDLANNVFEFAKNQRGITFEEEQALAIAQAVMNTAVGVTSALKKGVAGIPAALIVGAEGALQVAAIRSQTMHAGGIVGSTPDERPANLLTGEAVITRAGVDALGGSAGVNSINSGASMAPIVVVNQYKHRSLDVQIRDQLRSDSALTRATAGGQRMGHR